MSVKAQKLLVPILIRSNKPCVLTAGKLYILSLQSFGSVWECHVSMTLDAPVITFGTIYTVITIILSDQYFSRLCGQRYHTS